MPQELPQEPLFPPINYGVGILFPNNREPVAIRPIPLLELIYARALASLRDEGYYSMSSDSEDSEAG